MVFLVDGDNNIGTGLKGVDLLSEKDTVLIFHKKGLSLTKIKALCAGSRADVQYVESVRGGKNSIDFQIITELGVLVGKGEADYAYVISQDKGYEASISALRTRYAETFREVALRPSIEDCLQLSFLLRASNRQELSEGLAQEYGEAQGALLYTHLRQIFLMPEGGKKPAQQQQSAAPAKQAAAASVKQTADAPAKQAVPAQSTAAAQSAPAQPSKPQELSTAAKLAVENAAAAVARRTHRGSRGGRRKKAAPAEKDPAI